MLARILWFITGLVVLVLAFFFVAAALVVGAALVAVLLARVWWVSRRVKKAAEQQIITAEYTVIERERESGQRLPDESERQQQLDRHSRAGGGTDATTSGIPPARE